ncbi:MAG: hypothetical protein BWZ08_02357 [candidate division BRC1 bacterium ADurb.BinA292]|nr:MAG: hypothetical protein BWZ08_02357 [candidate division BRC1 bacterium ADurb.BinA292]
MWGNATTMPGKKSSNPQLDIRIGTLVNGMQRDVAGYIRAILPHGFESLQLTFNAGVVDLDLKKLAASVKAAIGDADVVISALGIYANPLESGEDDRKAALGWRKLIDAAHLFGAGLVSGFTGRLRGQPIDHHTHMTVTETPQRGERPVIEQLLVSRRDRRQNVQSHHAKLPRRVIRRPQASGALWICS